MDRKLTTPIPLHRYKIYLSCLFLMFFFLVSKTSYSQVVNSGQILRAGSEDANVLLQEYLKPFGGGFGADLNSGWFSSARPLQPFGFDLRISASASFVPSKDRVFDVTALNLNTVRLLNGPSETPTILGDDTGTSTLGATNFNSSTQQEDELFSFDMPTGSGYHFVPAPMAQFSLGLPGHTQVTLRYSPELVIENDYRLSVFGIGGMVGLNQLLFNGNLPIDISLQAGIMDLNANAKFDVRPDENENIENSYPDSQWDGQAINFSSNTFTTNIIVGKTISILSLFSAVGYQHASTKITTKGNYPLVIPVENNSTGSSQEIQSIKSPVNFSLHGANKMHILGGFQLKLGFISISTAYTFSEYSTFRAGVGIIFRS